MLFKASFCDRVHDALATNLLQLGTVCTYENGYADHGWLVVGRLSEAKTGKIKENVDGKRWIPE